MRRKIASTDVDEHPTYRITRTPRESRGLVFGEENDVADACEDAGRLQIRRQIAAVAKWDASIESEPHKLFAAHLNRSSVLAVETMGDDGHVGDGVVDITRIVSADYDILHR